MPKLIDAAAPLGTLVLFTSRRQMQEVHDGLPARAGRLCAGARQPASKAVLLARHHERLAAQQASVILVWIHLPKGWTCPVKPACR